MIQVGPVLISSEVVEARFGCRLESCRGDCCRLGDAGSPLAPGERAVIATVLPRILETLPGENLERLAAGWTELTALNRERLTCFPDGRCVFSRAGSTESVRPVLGCVLEAAFLAGQTTFRKPRFCHLFPLRVDRFQDQPCLNVERRPECESGWEHGPLLFEFSREALVREFGLEWYEEALAAVRCERAGGRKPGT